MKSLTATCLIVVLLCACKKIIEQQKENAIIDAMTNGQWVITSFVRDGSNITASFGEYSFQYHRDYTVDAIRNNNAELKGTWNGDPATMTITATFTTSTEPLVLLNGPWHIDNNSWTYVVASQTNGAEQKKLRLEKK